MDLRQRGRLHRSFGPLVLATALSWCSVPVAAQGVTTAAISGAVRAENGADVDGTPVRVVNLATGYRSETRVRGGNYVIQGLDTGGPYTVEIRRIGFAPQTDTVSSLSIGDRRGVDFVLVAVARLGTVVVPADIVDAPSGPGRGIGTSISDSTLRRLPTLNGDIYDFVRTVPQVGTRFGLSGGGAAFRFNGYFIDGLSERVLQNNGAGAGGGSLSSSSNRTISLEAVKEYQVLLSPFDARYGDFTGLLVNAVTKGGTNDLHGSAYGEFRNAQLARSGSFLGTSSYEREVYGFSLGGPIVRNRIHLFIAPEIQSAVQPARGPWVGQASDAPFAVPVSPDTVARFASLLHDRGLDPGDGGRVMLPNPNVALFGRLDVALPEVASRLVLRESYSQGAASNFQRQVPNHNFQLTSVAALNRQTKRTVAAQLFSQLSPAVFNEFQLGHTDNPIGGGASAQMPSISVSVVGGTLGAGPQPGAQGVGATGSSTEIGDYVVFQPGAGHTLGFGAHVEFFRYAITGVKTAYGQWAFPSLDALAAGAPSSFTIGRDFGSAASPVAGAEPSLYASDEWRLNDRVSVTLGLRADGLTFSQRPAYNPEVDSVFHRRTTDFPRFRPQWSPRVGFMWQPDDDHRTSIRGGAGLFVGRPPLGWLVGPMRSDGVGMRTLSCAAGIVPAFTPYPAVQPTTCTNGSGPANGPVTLVDQKLRMAETLRASIGVDQRLPWNLIGGVEALYSRVRSDFGFFNLTLGGPTGIDSHGRVMYGSIGTDGVTHPSPVAGNSFSEVVDLRNQTGGYSWSVTGQLHKPWSDRLEMGVSYTYSRVRDVRSITSNMIAMPLDLWAGERPGSGRLDDATTGVSAFEIPHRVVLSATYAARWKHRTTDVSLYYIGESGVPFTYGDSTAGKFTGDLNADGTGADDPIYVPRDATNPAEIAFAGSPDSATAQGAAFEKFIHSTPCLDRLRGRIVARNSCRSAWVNTSNLSVRQSLPELGGHAATVQLEVFNVLNLLNKSWGLFEVPNPWILQNAGWRQTPVPQPLYTFSTPARNVQNAESSYQLQLSLRYSF